MKRRTLLASVAASGVGLAGAGVGGTLLWRPGDAALVRTLERAVVHVQDDGTKMRFLAIEDVIVHNLIANRSKDASMIARRGSLLVTRRRGTCWAGNA